MDNVKFWKKPLIFQTDSISFRHENRNFQLFPDYVAILIIDFMISFWHVHIKARLIKMLKVRHIFQMTRTRAYGATENVTLIFWQAKFFCQVHQIYHLEHFSKFSSVVVEWKVTVRTDFLSKTICNYSLMYFCSFWFSVEWSLYSLAPPGRGKKYF